MCVCLASPHSMRFGIVPAVFKGFSRTPIAHHLVGSEVVLRLGGSDLLSRVTAMFSRSSIALLSRRGQPVTRGDRQTRFAGYS